MNFITFILMETIIKIENAISAMFYLTRNYQQFVPFLLPLTKREASKMPGRVLLEL